MLLRRFLGISALVELASHGLITHETEKETSSSKQRRGSRLDLQQDQNDDLFDDIDPNSNSLVPMNTVLTRVAPRLLRTVQSIEGVDAILPIFDKVNTKTMGKYFKRRSEHREWKHCS